MSLMLVATTIAGAWTLCNTRLLSLVVWASGTNSEVVAGLLASMSFQQLEPRSEEGATVMAKILARMVAVTLVMEMETGSLPGVGKRGDVE